eukprot:scaffold9936_cov130-Isochrysis_galbana.AAC.3
MGRHAPHAGPASVFVVYGEARTPAGATPFPPLQPATPLLLSAHRSLRGEAVHDGRGGTSLVGSAPPHQTDIAGAAEPSTKLSWRLGLPAMGDACGRVTLCPLLCRAGLILLCAAASLQSDELWAAGLPLLGIAGPGVFMAVLSFGEV